MSQNTDHTSDAEHKATVDRILSGGQAAAPAPAPARATAAQAPSDIAIPAMTPIENSSQLDEYGHDATTGHLFLRFKGKGGKPGGLYRYGNFGETDLQAFADAESKGSHFARAIKPHADRYPCERVPEPAEQPGAE